MKYKMVVPAVALKRSSTNFKIRSQGVLQYSKLTSRSLKLRSKVH